MKKFLVFVFSILVLVSCNKDDDTGNPSCPDPVSLEIVQVNSTSLNFRWDASNGTAWQFEYGSAGFDIGTGTVRSTSQDDYLITDLTPLTAYTVHLRNNCGSNGFSNYTSLDFTTLAPIVNCNQPTDLMRIGLGANFIEIVWNENNETAWEVEYGLVGHTVGSGTVVQRTESNYRIEGLSSQTTYEIYVRANCGNDGFSEYTAALVVTTD
jgi:hypothetical protein